MKKLVILIGILLLVLPGVFATTYYVSTTGSDSNPGTQASPFLTINKATGLVVAGDTVIVRGGTYKRFLVWNKHGDANNWITIKTYPGETVIVDNYIDNTENGEDIVSLPGSSYIEINGFILTDSNPKYDSDNFSDYSVGYLPEQRGIDVTRSLVYGTFSNHIRIINNLIYHTGSTGIGIGPDESFIEVINNTIHHAGMGKRGYCMYVNGKDITIRGNILHDCYGYGIHGYSSSGTPERLLIENNIIYNNGHSDYGLGYPVWGPWVNVTEEGIYRGAGVLVWAGSGHIIRNNIIYNNFRDGMDINGNNGTEIYNNIIYGNGISGTYDDYGIYIHDNSGPIVKNNIVYQNNGGKNTRFTAFTTHDHNLVGIDPLFVDEANKNFHLQSDSPAIDAGVAISNVTSDFDGVLRPQGSAYDIGAYEYVVAPPSPTLGTATLSSVVLNSTTSDASGDLIASPSGAANYTTLIYDWRLNGTSIALLNLPFDTEIPGGELGKDYSTYDKEGRMWGVTWNENCVSGGCYYFDGNDYIDFYDRPEFDFAEPTDKFSISAWINLSAIPSENNVIASKYNSNGDREYFFSVNPNMNLMLWMSEDGTSGNVKTIKSNITIPIGEMTHVATSVDFETDEYKLYINGVEAAVTETGNDIDTLHDGVSRFMIGAVHWSTTNPDLFFVGTMDEVQVYNRSLSSEQIQNLYNLNYNSLVNQETNIGDEWTVAVTPNNGEDGTTAISNGLSIESSGTTTTTPGTTETSSSSSSGGGGGGGGTSSTPSVTETQSVPQATPLKSIIFTGFNPDLRIKQVEVKVNTEVENPGLAISKYESRPEVIPVEKKGLVYRYLEFQEINIGNSLDKAIITFFVDRDWVDGNELKATDVSFFRYNDGLKSWNELPTTYNTSDDDYYYYYYEAESDDFGFFSIGEKGSSILKSKIGGVAIFAIILGVLALGIIVAIIIRVKKKSESYTTVVPNQ